jgi:hypothetical protein
MALIPDIVKWAAEEHVRRGHTIDRQEDQQSVREHFLHLGLEEKRVRSSLEAIAPTCLSIVRGVPILTMFRPTKLCIHTDRIVAIRRFLWFYRLYRHERAIMIDHIREVECDFGIISATMIFRTFRGAEIFRQKFLRRRDARKATRVIQALIHDELHHEWWRE